LKVGRPAQLHLGLSVDEMRQRQVRDKSRTCRRRLIRPFGEQTRRIEANLS